MRLAQVLSPGPGPASALDAEPRSRVSQSWSRLWGALGGAAAASAARLPSDSAAGQRSGEAVRQEDRHLECGGRSLPAGAGGNVSTSDRRV